PADLFYLVDAGGSRDMPGFDDLLIDHAERLGAPAPAHDALFELEYKPAGIAGLSLFEVAPLVRSLRGLVLGARPLRPSDLALHNEAAASDDAGLVVRADKAAAVRTGLQGATGALDLFISALEGAALDAGGEAARDSARDNIDQWLDDYASALRPVLPFGLQAASLTTGVEGRRGRLGAMLKAIGDLLDRWNGKQDNYDSLLTALPAASTDEERTAILVEAGRAVSTRVIAPLPPTIAALELEVAALRSD